MTGSELLIERLSPTPAPDDVRALARLLVDAVDSGAAVSFVAPLSVDDAERWWRATIAGASPRAAILVARDGGRIVGTVQLHPAWAPNQPHRGDVAKLIVDRGWRGRGLGRRLMDAVEDEARRAGLGLLVLDAKRGADAEHLYRRLGWIHVGTIPDFAVDPDGVTLHDDVIFYKRMDRPEDR